MVLIWNRIANVGLLAFLMSSGIMADEFDPGGVTFDFQKISDSRLKNPPKSTAENLVGNPDFSKEKSAQPYGYWFPYTGVADEFREQIKDLVVHKVVDLPEGGKAAYIKKTLELETVLSKGKNVTGSWRQLVKMPDMSGGRYSINFRYKGAVFGKFATTCWVVLDFKDNSGSLPSNGTSIGAKSLVYSNPKQDWQQFTADFEVPANTAWVELYLRIDGTGEIYFADVQMRKGAQDTPLSIGLMPMALLDNTFCLSQEDPAIMTFAWRRNLPKDKMVELKQPVLYVELPDAVQVKAVNRKLISSEAKTIDGKLYTLHKIDLSVNRKRPMLLDDYDSWESHSLLIFTIGAPDTALPDGFYWVSDGDNQLTNKESFHLKVIPSIRLSAKPNIFMNGFVVGGHYMDFSGTENKEFLGRFFGDTGTSWIIPNTSDAETVAIYRRNGIRIVTPQLGFVYDGYVIGSPKDKPEYAKFKSLGKTQNVSVANATCPVAIYNESEYLKKSVMPYLETNLKGFDGLWANWELHMFNGMGCFCDNCRDEFIKYSKLPADEVKAAWPKEMTIGKKYYDICTKFRSYQHALLMKTIDKAVNSVTTGKAGFIPGIAFDTLTDSQKGRDACKEFDPLDYAGSFKYINPWGPYPWWFSSQPYSYGKGSNLITFVLARKVREFTDKNFTNPKERPKLLAYPTGLQCIYAVTQPEAITMDIISFFLNRYDASTTYYFPSGYDNRYWAAQAEASRVIAEYEKFVFNGSSFDGVSSVPVTPFPAPVKRPVPTMYPEMPPADLLQTAGFKLDGKFLAAVGNFWEKGDVFFKLSVKGLDKDTRYVVIQPDKKRYFSGEKNDSFTGSELKNGIMVQVGALRWAFFVIEPFKENADYGKRITSSDINAALNKHLPEITKAADIEKKADDAEAAENQKSELKPLTNGKLSCTPVDGTGGEQQLKFKAGDNELLVGLNGILVKSWQINKNEFVSIDPDGKVGLGLPAFWEPSVMFTEPYHVKKLEATKTGIIIVAERAMKEKDSAALEYITVRQRIEVNSDCSAVKFETELLNATSVETGPRDIAVGFRYHNMPLCIGDGGSVVMKDRKQEIVFKRKFERMLFKMPQAAESAAQMKRLFEVATPEIEITAPEAVFISKDSKLSIAMLLTPAASFAGFACWDTPTLKSPTFEPFFNPVTIKAQESAKYSMSLEVK